MKGVNSDGIEDQLSPCAKLHFNTMFFGGGQQVKGVHSLLQGSCNEVSSSVSGWIRG